MTKRAAAKKTTKKLPKDLSINRRREWRFDLPLRTVIEGQSPAGRKFHEETKLENISSGGAYFSLDSGVVVGSKLNLMIELPVQTHRRQEDEALASAASPFGSRSPT